MGYEYGLGREGHTEASLVQACLAAQDGDFIAQWADIQDLRPEALEAAQRALSPGVAWRYARNGVWVEKA